MRAPLLLLATLTATALAVVARDDASERADRRSADRRLERAVAAAPPSPEQQARARADRMAIATPRNETPISAYAGHVVWSELGTRGWSLRHWHAGAAERLPIPPRPKPFDVDLGPDEQGRPTAVYSRCAPRCRIHRLALEGRRAEEEPLGVLGGDAAASEHSPSIWRGAIAFAARGRGERVPRLLLHKRDAEAPTALAQPKALCGPHCRAHVTGLDLGAKLAAIVWRVDDREPEYGIGPTWEVWSHRRADGTSELLDEGFVSGTCGSVVPKDSQAAGGRVVFLQQRNTCDAQDGGIHSFFVEQRPGSSRQRRVEPYPIRFPAGQAYAMARDGDTTYWLYGTPEYPNPEAGAAGHPLVRSR
jgi:hypothetical protein